MRALILLLACLAPAVTAQAPPTYYSTVNTTSSALLRSTLHAVIDDHTRIPYTATGTDTWNVLELADQHPSNSTQILDLYQNAAYTKVGGGNTFYNREHTWPNSYGFPNDGGTNYPYTDCHHLFLCDIAYNSARDNKPFASGAVAWAEWTTVVGAGQGGGSGTFPGNSNWAISNTSSPPLGGWQTWSARKGDVARALLYMDVRYEGGTHGITGAAEPDLRLTDDQSLIANSATGSNLTIAYMGRLSVLLQWHDQDPPDQKEMAHTNAVFTYQGNRNPFVDHPEWAACVFSGNCVRVREPEVWINELHYDNVGVDVGEFVEIAGPAGDSVSGWMLVGHDGATGAHYGHVKLSGTIPDQQNGFGTLSFAFPGLQDGGPDGIALITNTGVVMHFVSYEGAFTAVGGAAAARTSVNIGVSEAPSSPIGFSLQLGGTGSAYSEFAWQTGQNDTPGARNLNQTFQ